MRNGPAKVPFSVKKRQDLIRITLNELFFTRGDNSDRNATFISKKNDIDCSINFLLHQTFSWTTNSGQSFSLTFVIFSALSGEKYFHI